MSDTAIIRGLRAMAWLILIVGVLAAAYFVGDAFISAAGNRSGNLANVGTYLVGADGLLALLSLVTGVFLWLVLTVLAIIADALLDISDQLEQSGTSQRR